MNKIIGSLSLFFILLMGAWIQPAMAAGPYNMGRDLSNVIHQTPIEPVDCNANPELTSQCTSGPDLIPSFQTFNGEPETVFVWRNFTYKGKAIDATVCEQLFSGKIQLNLNSPNSFDLYEVCEGFAPLGTTARQYLMRFAISAINIGPDPFFVGSPPSDEEASMPTCGCVPNESCAWVYSPSHRHCHVKNLWNFELLHTDGTPVMNAEGQVTGRKLSFATIDDFQYCKDTGECQGDPQVTSCNFWDEYQGITPGFGDLYTFDVPGNYLVVTGILPGDYILKGNINAEEGGLATSDCDPSNNSTYMNVHIPPAKEFHPDYADEIDNLFFLGRGKFGRR